MSDNVESVTHEILRSVQASIAALRAEMRTFREETRVGFEDVKSAIAKERRNSAGALVMMRATAGTSMRG